MGAYKVLERMDKAFNIDYGIDEHWNELTDWVSIDRLKPAHVDDAVNDRTGYRHLRQ